MKTNRAAITPEGETRSLPFAGTRPVSPAKRDHLERYCCWLGSWLLALFLFQLVGGYHWSWLEDLQANDTFKQLSGLTVLAYLAHQWHLSVLRTRGKIRMANGLLKSHLWMGSLAPLFFYFHTQQFGYAYQSVLSGGFFSVFITGLFRYEVKRARKPWLQTLWLITHVSSAVILLFLLSYHVYISYAYQ